MGLFIKVGNSNFEDEKKLTAKELYVISYMKYITMGRERFNFRMQDFINHVRGGSSFIYYKKGDKSKVAVLDDKRSLAPILDSLVSKGYIKTEVKFSSVSANTLVSYELLEDNEKGFEGVTFEFMDEMFREVGVYGFTLYCYLKKIHNVSKGYAEVKFDNLVCKTGYSRKVVQAYLTLLEDLKLINIDSSYGVNRYEANFEDKKFKSNKYVVPSKQNKEDRYYNDNSKKQ